MFDNAIFASFIPQILMVFAFILCFSTSNKLKPQNDSSAENQIIISEINQDIQQPDKLQNTINFNTDFYNTSYFKVKNADNIIAFLKIEKSIELLKVNSVLYLFLRPPPIFQ